MLRCTVAGMMPLMKSEEYKSISEQLYTSRLGDFEKIREKKSYYAIPNLPKNIAKEILEPIIPDILRSVRTGEDACHPLRRKGLHARRSENPAA